VVQHFRSFPHYSKRTSGQYLEIGHNVVLPNSYLLTVHDHLPISFDATLLQLINIIKQHYQYLPSIYSQIPKSGTHFLVAHGMTRVLPISRPIHPKNITCSSVTWHLKSVCTSAPIFVKHLCLGKDIKSWKSGLGSSPDAVFRENKVLAHTS
jgi:hypothetical protein